MHNKQKNIRLTAAGEMGLVVEFGQEISPKINASVHQFSQVLRESMPHGILELVPTYCAVTIYFDPVILSRERLTKLICTRVKEMDFFEKREMKGTVVYIPVCYGGVLGPDIEYVAKYTGLSVKEIICQHTEKPYQVYMLGFTPGFPYLGGVQESLFVPRQKKPRLRVPIGSVGIGGGQTGFYPSESPGEWWLIGRTPVKAFDPAIQNPFLLTAGDFVQFFSVDMDMYFSIRREVLAHTYVCRREEVSIR